MIESTNLKNGVTFLSNGKPYRVIKYNLIKMGRGGATVRVNVRNLETGGVEEKTFSSTVKVEEVITTKRQLQYLYKDGNIVYFMDPSNYEQIEIPIKIVESEVAYIKEAEQVSILFWTNNGIQKPLTIEIQPKVTLKVLDTPPGVKGNSAVNIYKNAKLENGLEVKVPLFVNMGDNIVIDTRSGEYVERAKS